jgi:hypothetical protein
LICLQAYAEAFFARPLSGMRNPSLQWHMVEMPIYSILSRTNSTIHITFTYDDDIKLQPLSHA